MRVQGKLLVYALKQGTAPTAGEAEYMILHSGLEQGRLEQPIGECFTIFRFSSQDMAAQARAATQTTGLKYPPSMVFHYGAMVHATLYLKEINDPNLLTGDRGASAWIVWVGKDPKGTELCLLVITYMK